MPELPEVETTRRGLCDALQGGRINKLTIWNGRLRWPVADTIDVVVGQRIQRLDRRAKYLLIVAEQHSLMVHLGMSGSLRLCAPDAVRRKHDHWGMELASGVALRYHDPRRFGSLHLLAVGHEKLHPLLAHLGPEPLSDAFNGPYLKSRISHRQTSIKSLIMDARCVVGVGNIYACEALHQARIHPQAKGSRLGDARCARLVQAIKTVLTAAIQAGGTTLRDFRNGHDQPGYFQQSLRVYGRADAPCLDCATPVRQIRQQGRSTFYCPQCQRV